MNNYLKADRDSFSFLYGIIRDMRELIYAVLDQNRAI